MLRACNRVLKPGGRLAYFVVHLQPGLPAARRASACEAAPEFVLAPAPYRDLLERAGFIDVQEYNVTTEYHRTAATSLEETGKLEVKLRAALGDEVFEEKHANRRRSLAAIEAGELGRTLFAATAPRGRSASPPVGV